VSVERGAVTHFWDVSLANVITWLMIAITFIGSQYLQVKLNAQRMNGFEKWVEKHEKETQRREEVALQVQLAIVKLTGIAEASGQRIENLEARERWVRRDNPPPYYGPERRGKS
jgi:hypothetical protein